MPSTNEATQKLFGILNDQENINPNKSNENGLSFQRSTGGGSLQGQGLNPFSSSLAQKSYKSPKNQIQSSACKKIVKRESQMKNSACEEEMKRILNNLDSIQLKMKNSKEFNQQENGINEQDLYKIFEDLGKGSFGRVFRQLHIPTRKFYALKVLKGQNNKKKRRMEKQEFRILQIIKQANSPILLQIKDLEGFPDFFVRMECGSGTLGNFLNFCQRTNRMQDWKDDDILTLYFQLWSQLQVLKELNIFHSDIKPENIIISSEGFFVISDFGVSILLKKLGRQEMSIQGTYDYFLNEIKKARNEKKWSCEYDPMEQDNFACTKIIRDIIKMRGTSDSLEKLLERKNIKNEENFQLFETRNCIRIYDDNKEAYHIYRLDQIYEAYDWKRKHEIIDNLIEYCHFDQVQRWIEEKLEKVQKGQSQEYLYLCFLRGRVRAVQSKYQEALQDYTKCEEALREFEGNVDSKFTSRLYSEMGEVAVWNYDLELARKYLDKSFKIKFQDGNPTVEFAWDYLILACIEYFEGNRKKAVENCHKGLELFEPTTLNTCFLDLQNILGISLEALGRYDEADAVFQNLYKMLCQVYGETHSKVTKVLSNIAMILDNTGRSKDALSYNIKSLKINCELFLTNNRNQFSAYTLINMTVCYSYLGKLEEALSCARQSVQIIENSQNNDPYVFVWMIAIAEICVALKEYEGAEFYLQRYLDFYSQIPNSQGKIFLQKCFILWDHYVHKRKGNDLAYKKYENRLKYLDQNPQTHPVEAIVYQRFAVIEIMKGEYKAALRWLRKTHEILDQNQIEKSPSFFSDPGIDLHKSFKLKINLEEASDEDLKAFCEEYYEKCSPFLIVAPELRM